MRSKLFEDKPETVKTNAERWVRIMPDEGNGYLLYDLLSESDIGRILIDTDDNWIYDGRVLTVEEQEEIAGFITGNRKEMDDLIRRL